MTCDRAQKLITPFINDELDNEELDEFIKHVKSCSECYEELEVYYTLLTAMKQLDEEEKLFDDFGLELSAKMEQAEEKIIHIRFSKYRKKSILILVVIALTLFIGFQNTLGSTEEEDPIRDSDFRIRNEFNSERYDRLEEELIKSLE